MDELKIESDMMTYIIGKLLSKFLKKKLGYDVTVQFNEVRAVVVDGTAKVHLDIDGEIPKEELKKLIKKI